ncbi:hypothetical protein CPB83DRAFT_848344 [Crepidotus variabilis]|uniref:BHLH domain-containing protein n=1 Tax=Crepidotus variabilis TaxID=179855 RepID=A0A9P6EN85_9AGAR|nr:hypothetical protein CPB83DRAFT_848344 [Crepidotus variabilis]
MSTNSPLHPPVPFSDFESSYNSSMSGVYQNHPPQIPPSADLFSASETTDLLGFLDNFNDVNWDYAGAANSPNYPRNQTGQLSAMPPYSNPHLDTIPDPSTSSRPRATARSSALRGPSLLHDDRPIDFGGRMDSRAPSDPSVSPDPSYSSNPDQRSRNDPRSRPLLSTPQKRLNHIMSEQKRRNAIRDGYAQLISLLAPDGAPTIDMPTRGRPKGSGSHSKGQTKGKSGVLFRAVEYCLWLEEGRDALREEVLRVEAAAGIQHT